MGQPIREPEFDPQLFHFPHVVDIGLRTKAETLPSYTPKGWRSSSIGYCMRRLFMERAGVPSTRDSWSRTLWLGDMIHNGVQQMFRWSGLLIVAELELEDPELNLMGHVDMIWGGKLQLQLDDTEADYSPKWQDFMLAYRKELIARYGEDWPVTGTEMKSSHQYAAEKMVAEGPSFHHVMQAASYDLMASRGAELPEVLRQTGIDRWQLAIIAKNDLKMPIFQIGRSQRERVHERILELNDFWDRREVPPCTCGVQISWERKYCLYGNGTGDQGSCCREADLSMATSEEFWGEITPELVTGKDPAEGGADG